MNKLFIIASLLLASVMIISCSGEKRSARSQTVYKAGDVDYTKDSVLYYDSEVKAKIISFKKELEGEWKVITMRRQQKDELESLSAVSLVFTADSSFAGKAPCNRMGGVYTLKGAGIKFSNIYSTKMACAMLEQESAMLRLLGESVSTFTVTPDKLLLRDGSANIIFECVR